MPGPGAEEAIYHHPSGRGEARIAVSLDYTALTGELEDTFTTGLNARLWDFTWAGGASPPVVDDKVCFQSLGVVPPFHRLRGRELWLPADYDQPFKHEFGLEFPVEDPVYSPIAMFGGLRQVFADMGEPITIFQQGSATTQAAGAPSGRETRILFFGSGGLHHDIAWTDDEIPLSLEWDPNTQVNSDVITLRLDGTPIVTLNETPRWDIPKFGRVWAPMKHHDTEEYIEPLGSVDSPVDTMRLTYFRSTQLGTEGYESRSFPGWTFANQGATGIDDAEPGERFEEDGDTRAIIPRRYVPSGGADRGTESGGDELRLELNTELVEDLATMRWQGARLTYDTRRVTDVGTSSWKRQFSGYVDEGGFVARTTADGVKPSITATAEIHSKLNTYQGRQWRGDSTGSPHDNVGYTIAMILQDILEVADITYGPLHGEIDHLIRDMDLLPGEIGTLGETLWRTFNDLVDTMALEWYIDYPDTDSRGRARVHAATLGDGTADYTIPDRFATSAQVDTHKAPSQVTYRQSLALADREGFFNAMGLPTPAMFPYASYPGRGKPLTRSVSFSRSRQATAILALRDRDDAIISGGIAQHAYRYEASYRRQFHVTYQGQDYIEPSDELPGDVAEGALPDETFVVSQVAVRFDNRGGLWSEVKGRTSQWYEAARRVT